MKCKLQRYGHNLRSSGLAKTILQDIVKGGRKTWWTMEEVEKVGGEHQEMDRPGIHQVPEGSGEKREKWRKLVAKSSMMLQ